MQVERLRQARKHRALEEAQRTCFLLHGKNSQGFWGYEQMEEQAMDVIDCLEAPEPGRKQVLEVHHPAGHAKC